MTPKERRNAYMKAWNAAHPEKVRACKAAHYIANRERIRAKSVAYRAANREKIRAKDAQYCAAHREKARARAAAWRVLNLEREKAAKKARYAANPRTPEEREINRLRNVARYAAKKAHVKAVNDAWVAANPGKRNEITAARRTRVRRAMPAWVDRAELAVVYERARNAHMVVDHIVPLKHDLVCGLHVPWNLQLLTNSDNCSKRNKFNLGVQ